MIAFGLRRWISSTLTELCSLCMAVVPSWSPPSSHRLPRLGAPPPSLCLQLGQEVPVTKIPDNVQLLTDLLKLDLLITTPSQVGACCCVCGLPQASGSNMSSTCKAPHHCPAPLCGVVCLCHPSVQDYDDSYTIKYAQVHNACILTNDQFRDYVDKHVEVMGLG